MNDTPRGERLHIAVLGRRNAGKSSLINALTNQSVAIVSPVSGTTTDPVYKSMEILPIGPVVLIDTAGVDDLGELGELRVTKTMAVLDKADILILVIDPGQTPGEYEEDLLSRAREKSLPVIGVLNKWDLYPTTLPQSLVEKLGISLIPVSSVTGEGMEQLTRALVAAAPHRELPATILGDLIQPGDAVLLVTPIDQGAPKGRLILPQVQTIRDILDHGAYAVVTGEKGLAEVWQNQIKKPRLVITDAQIFAQVSRIIPPDTMLTAFSILFARYKGDLEVLAAGVQGIAALQPGDKVLIAEACTHHRVEDDIGRVKIPQMLRRRVGGELDFHWASGSSLPEDLLGYKLIVHCGGCMINRREMLQRIARVGVAGIPIVNYGILMAYFSGILNRALEPILEVRCSKFEIRNQNQ